MIKTILFFLLLVFFMIVGLLLWLPCFFLKLIKKEDICNMIMFWYVRMVCKFALVLIGIHFDTIDGLENITDEPALYVINHRSIFDIIIMYVFMKKPMGLVSKKEMKRVPLFSVYMWWVKCLFLDRNDIRQGLQTMNKGAEQLKAGVNMCIFPEGTRNKDYEHLNSLLPFRGGALKMAVKADAPIVPVAIQGSQDCFERQFPRMHSCHLRITFGKPIRVSELDKEHRKFLTRYVEDTIKGMLDYYVEHPVENKK